MSAASRPFSYAAMLAKTKPLAVEEKAVSVDPEKKKTEFTDDCFEPAEKEIAERMNLTCNICWKLRPNPWSSDCGHNVCRDCLCQVHVRVAMAGVDEVEPDECFVCHTKKPYWCDDETLKRQAGAIKVHCARKDCDWNGSFGDWTRHTDELCDERVITCTNKGCDVKWLAKDGSLHAIGCPHRVVQCLQCCDYIVTNKMDKHVADECSDRKVKCRLCGEFERIWDVLVSDGGSLPDNKENKSYHVIVCKGRDTTCICGLVMVRAKHKEHMADEKYAMKHAKAWEKEAQEAKEKLFKAQREVDGLKGKKRKLPPFLEKTKALGPVQCYHCHVGIEVGKPFAQARGDRTGTGMTWCRFHENCYLLFLHAHPDGFGAEAARKAACAKQDTVKSKAEVKIECYHCKVQIVESYAMRFVMTEEAKVPFHLDCIGEYAKNHVVYDAQPDDHDSDVEEVKEPKEKKAKKDDGKEEKKDTRVICCVSCHMPIRGDLVMRKRKDGYVKLSFCLDCVAKKKDELDPASSDDDSDEDDEDHDSRPCPKCKKSQVIKTSRTAANPGRKFWAHFIRSDCRQFDWVVAKA